MKYLVKIENKKIGILTRSTEMRTMKKMSREKDSHSVNRVAIVMMSG